MKISVCEAAISLNDKSKKTIGWREHIALPQLGILSVKAKIDTGARSSSIHAFNIECFEREAAPWVRFSIYTGQRSHEQSVTAEAPVIDVRKIRSSTGQVQERIVIRTNLELLDQCWPIELTLACREDMGFRMLLGRQAIRGRWVVDPQRSFCASRRRDH